MGKSKHLIKNPKYPVSGGDGPHKRVRDIGGRVPSNRKHKISHYFGKIQAVVFQKNFFFKWKLNVALTNTRRETSVGIFKEGGG